MRFDAVSTVRSAAYPNSPIVVMFPAASTILWNLGTFVVSASGNSPVCSSNIGVSLDLSLYFVLNVMM